jgi:hypothetical protein
MTKATCFRLIAVSSTALLLFAGRASAATTIGTDISTNGALSVDGATTLNGVAYSWTGTQGGVNSVLTNDGAGNLTWGSGSSFTGGTLTSPLVLDSTSTGCADTLPLSFDGDSDTGVVHSAANQFDLCIGGTLGLRVNATATQVPELAVAPDGSTVKGSLDHAAVGLVRFGTTTDVLQITGTQYVVGNRTENITRTAGVFIAGNELHATGTIFSYGDGAGANIQWYDGPGPGNGTGAGTNTLQGGVGASGEVWAGGTDCLFGAAKDVNTGGASNNPGGLPLVQDPTIKSCFDYLSSSSWGLRLAGIDEYAWTPGEFGPGPTRDNAIDLGDLTHRFKDIYSTGALTAGTLNTTGLITDGGSLDVNGGEISCGTSGACVIDTPSSTTLTLASASTKDLTLQSGSNKIRLVNGSAVQNGLINTIPGFGVALCGGSDTTNNACFYAQSGTTGSWEMQEPSTSATNINGYVVTGSAYSQLFGGSGLIMDADDFGVCSGNAITADPRGHVFKVRTNGAACTVTLASTNVSGLLAAAGATLGTNVMSSLEITFVVEDDAAGNNVTFTGTPLIAPTSACVLTHRGGTFTVRYIGSIGKFVPVSCEPT